jgi:hypothetical protein
MRNKSAYNNVEIPLKFKLYQLISLCVWKLKSHINCLRRTMVELQNKFQQRNSNFIICMKMKQLTISITRGTRCRKITKKTNCERKEIRLEFWKEIFCDIFESFTVLFSHLLLNNHSERNRKKNCMQGENMNQLAYFFLICSIDTFVFKVLCIYIFLSYSSIYHCSLMCTHFS